MAAATIATPAAKTPADITAAAPATQGKPLIDRITDAASVGLLLSLILHSLLLAAASLIYIQYASESKGLTVIATEAEEVASFEDVEEVSFDVGGAETSQIAEEVIATPQPVDPMAVPMLAALETATPVAESTTESVGSGKGTGSGSGAGSGKGLRLKAPSNAVSEGRFTAWTIPIPSRFGEKPRPGDSPRPGQSYHIVIELELPKNVRRYTIGDLQGTVVGTDGYRLRLPQQTFYHEEGRLLPVRSSPRLPIVDNRVQILVFVPGARALVRDRIDLRSRRLAETQTLLLRFES